MLISFKVTGNVFPVESSLVIILFTGFAYMNWMHSQSKVKAFFKGIALYLFSLLIFILLFIVIFLVIVLLNKDLLMS